MNDRRVIGIIILCLILCVISLSVICYNKDKILNLLIEDFNRLYPMLSIIDDRESEINSIGYEIIDLVVVDEQGRIINLSDLLCGGEKLVFRFSNMQCNSCFESQMEIMSEYLSGYDDLILITNKDSNIRHIKLINQRYSINPPVYKLYDDCLPLPVDSIGKPYYFRIAKHLVPFDIYVPDKRLPELTHKYLARVLSDLRDYVHLD